MSIGTKVSKFFFFCPDLNPFAPPALVPLVAAVREPATRLLLPQMVVSQDSGTGTPKWLVYTDIPIVNG